MADQLTFPSAKDNTLYENAGGTVSNGAGRYLFIGLTEQNRIRRSLIAFNLSAIPAGSTINSVSLTMFMSRTTAFDHDATLHRALADWGEGASDAPGTEGQGTAATTGDATWVHRFYPSMNWAANGGDFAPSPSATTVIGNAIDFYTWSGQGMVADVQAWVDDPAGNFGWVIRGDESVTHSAKRLDSRQSNVPANHPSLLVNFTPPPVTGACCFADTTCSELSISDCAMQSGAFQGESVPCSVGLCPKATGACCFPDATCQVLTPSDCATQSGAYVGLNLACTTDLCPVVLTPFLDPLPLPTVAQPVSGVPGGVATYDVAMRQIEQQLHQDLPPTTVWGYGAGPTGATYPGPTIEATSNQTVTVNWINDLRDSMGAYRVNHFLPVDPCTHGATDEAKVVVHVHGAHVPADSDGYPEDAFLPGQSLTYVYPNNQLPATIWYHDHALGNTRLNVYMGLAGFYLIRDQFEAKLGLPSGEYEIPLAIQDRSFHGDGSLKYLDMWHEHFFGDTILVNGKVWPYLSVKQGKYRFRMLNGSNSRTYTLKLSNDDDITLIGSDGGLLAAPAVVSEITLTPGERADVIIDFAPYAAGTEIILTNSAPIEYPGTPGYGVIPNVMKFIVQGAPGHTTAIPRMLRPFSPLAEASATLTRDFELRKTTGHCLDEMWMINDLHWDDITEFPLLGSTEVWRFINRSSVSHPMHLHMTMFQVLDRQEFQVVGGDIVPIGSPSPPRALETAWKDTVNVDPNHIVRVITRFDDYTGLFPYHCHILEHEDNEMMRQYEVVECLADADCNDGDACTLDTCMPDRTCLNDVSQCDDGDPCTINDACDLMDVCAGTPIVRLYGDAAPPPNGDGVVNLDDILCVLEGFERFSNCPSADVKPCTPNGIVNLDDILGILSAFSGVFACPHPCPP